VKSCRTYAFTETKSPIWTGSDGPLEWWRMDEAAMQSETIVVSWMSSCCDELSSERLA
jgi:hypothetical protein